MAKTRLDGITTQADHLRMSISALQEAFLHHVHFNLVAPGVDQNYVAPNFPVMGTITWS